MLFIIDNTSLNSGQWRV